MPSPSGLMFEDVEEGAEIPTLSVPLTLQRLVMEAGVNRDFAPMHFDRDQAQQDGQPDVFANTMLLQTLFEMALRQWAGFSGRLRKLSFRMNRPNYVGETVTAYGRVTGKRVEEGRGIVELEIWQSTEQHDRTLAGTAAVELPMAAAGGAP